MSETKNECGVGNSIHCTKKPAYNVLSQEEFQERARIIFNILDEILGKSFGAYGAPTIISTYPYTHVTKDGYRIARNIEFDFVTGEEVDRIIYGIAIEICARLNYTVGDGTTTAIIAANQIYKAAVKMFPEISTHVNGENSIQPKEILDILTELKDEIVDLLAAEATPVTPNNMVAVLRKIVNISSNGDKQITDLIVNAYEQIGSPAIRCENSDSALTYCDIVKGYQSKVRITDNIYINTEGGICTHKSVDVLVFDHMVKKDTYLHIIRPLTAIVRKLKRHLICIAPSYDEVTVQSIIRRDLNDEWQRTKDLTFIMTAYPASTAFDKKNIADLAMLLGTTLIDRGLENDILDIVSDPVNSVGIQKAININHRGIHGIAVFQNDDTWEIRNETEETNVDEDRVYLLRLGYATSFNASGKNSTFVLENYDRALYEKYLNDAKLDLENVIEKYALLGTYSRDIYEAQSRYTALQMNAAILYVGGDSTMSRDMLRDSVDDAIRAAESAYKYGYILGCNVTTSRVIEKMLANYEFKIKSLHDNVDEVIRLETKRRLLTTLRDGFREVYHRVLDNAIHFADKESTETVINTIIDESIQENMVYDLTKMTYTKDVINSVQTDIEILTASLDLLKIFLTGNQLLVTNYHHPN